MFRFVLLALGVGLASLSCAESLSFEATLVLATQRAPEIRAQTSAVEAAQALAISAGRLPDPKLAIGAENVPLSGEERWSLSEDFMTMRTVGLMQDFPSRAARHAQAAVAAANIDRARAEQRRTLIDVRREAALAWLNRYYLERRIALLDALEKENRLFAQSVQAQLTGDRGLPADVIAPQQEAADLADQRDELSAQIAKSKSVLSRWVGDAAGEPLVGKAPEIKIDSEHLRGHIHQHPELAALTPRIEGARAEVREAEAKKRPDWGVELSYGDRGSPFTDMLSMRLVMSLPVFSRTRQNPQITAKQEELSRLENEREAMLREHAAALDAELAEYDAITRRLDRIRNTRLLLAQEKVRYQFVSYRAGKTDLTNVLSARRELIDQQLKEVELQARHSAAAASLYFTYGEGATSEGVVR